MRSELYAADLPPKIINNMMRYIVYLDKDFEICGILDHISEVGQGTKKYIMDRGNEAFDKRQFEKYPRYYLICTDKIESMKELRIEDPRSLKPFICNNIRFISYLDIDKKLDQLSHILKIDNMRDLLYRAHTDYSIISLIGDRDFNLSDLLCSIRYSIEECSDSLSFIRDQIKKERSELHYIEYCRKNMYVNYKILVKSALKMKQHTLHQLKQRNQKLERTRSHLQNLMIMLLSSLWTKDISSQK